jgi:hypothetical protein
MMTWALNTPGIEKMIGTGVAMLGFEGRRTGKSYTIPVSYDRDNGTVMIVTKRERKWWHNFETPREVELRLAGRVYHGKAEIVPSDDEVLEYMVGFLAKRPIDAKAYGLAKDERTRDKIARIVPHIVLIRAEVSPE